MASQQFEVPATRTRSGTVLPQDRSQDRFWLTTSNLKQQQSQDDRSRERSRDRSWKSTFRAFGRVFQGPSLIPITSSCIPRRSPLGREAEGRRIFPESWKLGHGEPISASSRESKVTASVDLFVSITENNKFCPFIHRHPLFPVAALLHFALIDLSYPLPCGISQESLSNH